MKAKPVYEGRWRDVRVTLLVRTHVPLKYLRERDRIRFEPPHGEPGRALPVSTEILSVRAENVKKERAKARKR